MKKTKAFTLIEIIIAISLFSIIILFLYQSLELTKKSTQFFTQKVDNISKEGKIKKILYLDFINKDTTTIEIDTDDNSNTIVSLNTTNYYHNPFYKHVTYLLSKENNLLRIESLTKFNKTQLKDIFFNRAYIDILDNKIEKFKVKQNSDKIYIYINRLNGEQTFFSF